MGTPTIHRDLPWDEIRVQWERSEISQRALAAKYGMTSATTLVRKREAEGWVRDLDKPSGRIASSVRVTEPLSSDNGASTALPDMPRLASAPRMAERWRVRQNHGTSDTDAVLASPDAAGNGALDAELLLKSMTLREIQARSVSRQVALATELQATGLRLLRCLQAVLQSPTGVPEGEDPADADVLINLQRLIRINPDRETLAGLIAAATKTIDTGVAIERRALAALAPATSAGNAVRPEAAVKATMAMLARLDSQTADKLREWAVDVQREQREAQIAAASGEAHRVGPWKSD